MKYLLKKIISVANKLALALQFAPFKIRGNFFYLFRINSTKNNAFVFESADFVKSRIQVSGIDNSITVTNAIVSDSIISITGDHNKIILNDGVSLRKATIIVRGNHCNIFIGRNTTFGGIRIINVGSECAIEIGEGCLFADHIELWTSDTHPIYNENNEIINHEESIIIEDKVWVGSHVTILKGILIGEGSVIGMGTMVTRDILPHTINVGNPNRTVREGISWSLSKKNNEEN